MLDLPRVCYVEIVGREEFLVSYIAISSFCIFGEVNHMHLFVDLFIYFCLVAIMNVRRHCEAKLCVIGGDTSVITFVIPSCGWLQMDCRVYLLWRISYALWGL